MKNALLLTVIVACCLPLFGCPKKTEIEPDTEWQLPEGQVALRKITDPARMPDFTAACADRQRLDVALANSIHYMRKDASKKFFPYGGPGQEVEITHEQALASLLAFQQLLGQNLPPAEMNRRIRAMFDVYESVGYDNKGTVRFTAYYTPTFTASRTETPQFRYPIYRLPENAQVTADQGTVAMPNASRQQIESQGLLRGQELFYLADAFEAYVVQIQGSARLKLTDGTMAGIGYAGCNGMDYHPIRDRMVADGVLTKKQTNLKGMFEYFRANPQDVPTYTWQNPRFVFHVERSGPAVGSINEPVTKMRTVATDKKIFPRACLTLVSATLPAAGPTGMLEERPMSFFALDQDSGGGIRKAGRCDIYMGDDARGEALAGYTHHDGQLYYLFLKQ
ncbi:MAG: MltA domain-containing protein [Phycisphaerae bacterium]|nr:MltA domain-containing protein [Phycisphaerae bacterium]